MGKQVTDRLIETLNQDISITEFFREHQGDFVDISLADSLNNIIRRQNVTKAQVIRESGVNRRYFFDILSGKRTPDRNYILRILLSVGLPLEDAQWLLKATRYSQLYVRDRRDSVVVYCFERQLGVKECNEMLGKLKLELL